MARIHTHYDNLKIARGAPQEVVRAAYKALSQKYHPDKNPGDAKAARIMAIVNSAYGTLSDPVRRREHDEWIAAEEWEIAWLESTQAEEGRDTAAASWEPEPVAPAAPYRKLADPAWWVSLAAALALGVAGGVAWMSFNKPLPALVTDMMGKAGSVSAERAAPSASADPVLGGWAVDRSDDEGAVPPPDVKVVALSNVVIPARAPDCDRELRGLAPPTGQGWPDTTGYLGGFPMENVGTGVQVSLDNGANASPVLVKVIDSARAAVVRHVYLQPGARMVIDNLASGRYEVQYQNLLVGANAADCVIRRKSAPGEGVVSTESP